MNEIEEKKKRLNTELKKLLSYIELIDGLKGEYLDYQENISEADYLDEQTKLVVEAISRIVQIFNR